MDLYDLLGVRHDASAVEIRRAFQRKSRQVHPAVNPGDPAAVELWEAVSAAFETLADARRRAAYDRGERPVTVTTSYAEVHFEGFDFQADKATGANFREIFQDARETPGRRAPARGEDLEQVARITFDESMMGARRRLHVVRQEPCAVCAGAGFLSVSSAPACTRCGGKGQIRARRGHLLFSRPCEECGGRGVLAERPCPHCAGEGRSAQSEWLDVEIPPGAGDGSRVRLPGLGNAGRGGAPAGELTLVVEVEAHPFFRREGNDLHCVVPVTVVEAAAGSHIDVPTPDGSVPIEIPAGTQSGQRFRLRKRGAPELGGKGRGDLFVEARVVVPTVTDERGRALLRELGAIYPEDPRKEMAHGTRH
jgi:molecular chaperone DnaJ